MTTATGTARGLHDARTLARTSPVAFVPLGNPSLVQVSFTERSKDPSNGHFSFRRDNPEMGYINPHLRDNLAAYATQTGLDSTRVTWPYGGWPHTGRVIVAEHYRWETSSFTGGGIVPVESDGGPVQYDGIATCSSEFVLGAQSADCSPVILVDDTTGIIGIAHGGWKPAVRGVVTKTVAAMIELGAKPANIEVFIGPGAGRLANQFRFNDVIDVFEQAGRLELMESPFRRAIGAKTTRRLKAVGVAPDTDYSLDVAAILTSDLIEAGVPLFNIVVDERSCVLDERLHSYRRDKGPDPKRTQHGLNLATIRLL